MTSDSTGEAIRRVPTYAGLDDATLAVRTMISASQDLSVRMARVMRMNVTDMRALLVLSEHGSMGPTELARHLGITLASTTVLVDRMEQAGHLERIRDTADRRRVTVTDTAAAKAVALTAWWPAIREIDEVCAGLTDDERIFAVDLLGRLAAAMERGGRP